MAEFKIENFPLENQNQQFSPEDFPLEQPQTPIQGWRGVGQDIKSGIKNVPAALAEFVFSLPRQALSAGEQVLTDPSRFGTNLAAGLANTGKGLLNIPSNLATYLKSKGIGQGELEDIISKMHIPENLGIQNFLLGKPRAGDVFSQGLGSLLAIPGLGAAESGATGFLKRALGNALYGASQNQNPITSALLGGATEGLTRGAQGLNIPRKLLPSTPLNPEQLQDALEVTKGTSTGLGNVIDNPFLKKTLENVFPEIPLSGANPIMQKTAQSITNTGENLLDELKGNADTSNIGSALQTALKAAEKDTLKQKDVLFKNFDQAAAAKGITTSHDNLFNIAQEELNRINSNPVLSAVTGAPFKKQLQEILNAQNKTTGVPLKEANLLRSNLGKKASASYASNDPEVRALGGLYGRLRDAADEDIRTAIANHPKLNNLYDNAMDYYRKEYVPFLDKDIVKFTREGGDPDLLIRSFIKNSRISDRSNLLQKLTQKLSNENRNLLAYGYLANRSLDENGNFRPLQLRTALNSKNLGDRQRAALFAHNPKMLKAFQDYSKLVGKNTEPLTLMFNPKTGIRAGSFLPIASALASLHSLPTGIATEAIPTLGARVATKALTSEPLRERIVNALINKKSGIPVQRANIAPFIDALAQASQTYQGGQ